ncbi:ATP-binding cassette domain-containing protein [Actinacidiphila guanduensis]|uniref:Colicin V processing peptidase. Cysteine peptidase. MEROPS family C39 n=1 Tax=Actinacidiphila guanduensis TaxID=310781 RepID=A0A1H0MD18_9ACTN|nr:ATP-binding cassette domain-containing protein [Actinacidiphila guanduensis]SDO78247.1 colicin V processing peptidase. Cysteine peptidase. MEROPS family C39 [Actinacidiphila guanduensis]
MRSAPLALGRRVRRVPYVPQTEETDCAPACLASVLACHGRRVPLRELREATGASRDGVDALTLVRAARGYGLAARAVRVTTTWRDGRAEVTGLADLPLPVIVHLRDRHFMVLERVSGGTATLVDPALGRHRRPVADLAPDLSGIVLVAEPGPHFRPGGARAGTLRRIAGLLAGQWTGVLVAVLLSLVACAAGLALAMVLKLLAGALLAGGSAGQLQFGAALLATGVLAGGVAAALNQILGRFQIRQSLTLSVDLVWRLLHIEGAALLRREPGAMASRVQSADAFAQGLIYQVVPGLAAVVNAALIGVVMVHEDRVVGLTAVGLGLLAVAIPVFSWHRQAAAAVIEQRLTMRRDAVGFAVMRSIDAVKGSGGEAEVAGYWTSRHAVAVRASALHTRQQQGINSAAAVLAVGAAGAVALVSAPRILATHMTFGSLFAIQSLTGSFVAAASAVVLGLLQIPGLRTQLDVLDDLLGERSDVGAVREVGEDTGERLAGHLRLEGVTAGYTPARPALRDVDLTVRAGEWLAVTGPTGAGKTSLARLLAGVLQPQDGQVLLDGRPARSWPRGVLVRSVAWVDQNIELFAGTVADNLTLWDDDTAPGALDRALHDACLDEVIARRGGPHAAVVTEGGDNFSGGERQRLEVARALLTDPSILILDEATGALDRAVERELFARLRRRGVTVIMLAHRRSAVDVCDREVVVRGGTLREAQPPAGDLDGGGPDNGGSGSAAPDGPAAAPGAPRVGGDPGTSGPAIADLAPAPGRATTPGPKRTGPGSPGAHEERRGAAEGDADRTEVGVR